MVEKTEEVIPSRWLDVWKVKDTDEPNDYPEEYHVPKELHAKSRWIIQGYKNPSLLVGAECAWQRRWRVDVVSSIGCGP
eukprot:1299118-Amphidinium_carterae.2